MATNTPIDDLLRATLEGINQNKKFKLTKKAKEKIKNYTKTIDLNVKVFQLELDEIESLFTTEIEDEDLQLLTNMALLLISLQCLKSKHESLESLSELLVSTLNSKKA
jgi:hypothetical protein